MEFRRLTTVEEFAEVLALEQRVFGYTTSADAVPVSMLLVSSRIGGLVIGAFETTGGPVASGAGAGQPVGRATGPGAADSVREPAGGRLAGFVFSMPGIRDAAPYQWSHMLGVDEPWRNAGLGWRLKIEQRRLVMASGIDLVAWTFDPLQAANAHLNFRKLGATASRYHENAYPGSSSRLHEGTPTDRLVVDWRLRSERVARRIERAERASREAGGAPDADALAGAVPVNRVAEGKQWLEPRGHDLAADAAALAVVIPTGFTEMQQRDLALAREWRAATREIFETLLARGYLVDDFVLDRPARRGTYRLTRR